MNKNIKIHYIENERISLDLPVTRAELDQEISHLTHKTKYYELNLIEVIPDVFNFYAAQLEDDDEHEAGYKWASRCSIINEYFGTELIDVDCYCTNTPTPQRFGVRVSDLKEILPEEYTIVKKFFDAENKEPHFEVIKKSFLEKYLNNRYYQA